MYWHDVEKDTYNIITGYKKAHLMGEAGCISFKHLRYSFILANFVMILSRPDYYRVKYVFSI